MQPTSFRQLTFLAGGETAPALSPDGESFAYVKEIDGRKDVFLQRVGGSKPVNLTADCAENDDEPAFSPDGKRIAYRSECGGRGIFVMGAMGESPRKVGDFGHDPSWSPDGREIAVADEKVGTPFGRGATSKLWAVRVETGERRLLAGRDAIQASWSPDGRRVAFWGLAEKASTRDLYTVAADGSQSAEDAAVRVLDDPPVDWSPIWSADGRSLLFASTRGGTMNLWRIAVDPASGRPTGTPRPMTVPSSWVGFLSASADGRRVAYLDRNVRNTVRRAPFDPVAGAIAGPARTVPLGTIEPYETLALSPDGTDLVFDDAGFPQRLFLVDAKGLLRQLTEGPHRDRQGAFSPDGAWIAFQTDRWPGKLALIRPDGSGLRDLATNRTTSAFYPVWSPDGRWLACSSTEGAFLLPMGDGKAAGEPAPIAAPDEDGVAFWPSSFSPDGRQLAGILPSAANVVSGAALYTISDRTYRKLPADDPTRLDFLPDGRRLLVAAPRGLGVLDLTTGRLRPLVAATEGSEIVWAALSRDARHLAWHERADESDIWLAELGGTK
jgi:Tol biopolymer transport system component